MSAVPPTFEPCPFCGIDRPGTIGAGCLECRGRGAVGPSFRANRGLPPLAKRPASDVVETWNAAIDAATDAVTRVASMSPGARGDALLALLSVRRVGGPDARRAAPRDKSELDALDWAIASLENVRSVYPPGAEYWADDRRQRMDALRALRVRLLRGS